MVPSNHSFFQYCDSNIGLFYIAPCKVSTLYPLLNYRSSNYRDSNGNLFAVAFKSEKERQISRAIAIVGRAITLAREQSKKKNYTKSMQKGLRKMNDWMAHKKDFSLLL